LIGSIFMETRVRLFMVVALVVVSPQVAAAVSPTPAETGESRRWVAAKLEGVEDKKKSGQMEARAKLQAARCLPHAAHSDLSGSQNGVGGAQYGSHWEDAMRKRVEGSEATTGEVQGLHDPQSSRPSIAELIVETL
jgi:hypothetical protein